MGVLFCMIVKLFSWSVPRLMFFSSLFEFFLSSACCCCEVLFCWWSSTTESEPFSTVFLRFGNVSFDLFVCEN